MGSVGVISLTGVGATVGVPVAVVGGGLATHSVFVFKRSAQNLINGSGQVKAEPNGKNGETNSTKTGRVAHDNYKPGAEYKVDRKDTGLENGKFPDAVDYVNDIVRELKPNNKRKIREGTKQVRGYADQL